LLANSLSGLACVDKAVPCRIAFERGKERHLSFVAISKGTSGWVLLAEELPLKQQRGIVRVTAPLSGSDVSLSLSLGFCLCVRSIKISDVILMISLK